MWDRTAVLPWEIPYCSNYTALQLPREPAHLQMDMQVIVETFVVVVTGGLGSIAGAFWAAVLIGFAGVLLMMEPHGGLAALLSLQLSKGVLFALLFTVLCASGSYIAVPAAFRVALPQANPGVYLTMSLGVTFPLNVLVGIEDVTALVQAAVMKG